MSLFQNGVASFRRFDETFFSVASSPRLGPCLAERLGADKLVIADVGAAGGVQARWSALRNYVEFLTFEPRPGEVTSVPGTTNFPVALGARKEVRTLHLAKFGQSSSLYPLNLEFLNDFVVHESYQTVGTVKLEVSTLDECLAQSNLVPDFLKLDVEGAEMEVLTGSKAMLEKGVLGVQAEVSFSPRHLGAPLFSDIDPFLRQRGFQLFTLSRELMLRHSDAYGPISQPQLVWGDAVYFLSREAWVKRLASLAPELRERLLLKFVLILIAYRAHDYALELLEAKESADAISPALAQELQEAIRSSLRTSGFLVKSALGLILALVVYLLALPQRQARTMATFYLKRRAGYLLFYLWRLTARGGERNASVSDPAI